MKFAVKKVGNFYVFAFPASRLRFFWTFASGYVSHRKQEPNRLLTTSIMEDISKTMADAKAHMEKALEHLEHELVKLRTGKANTTLVADLLVDYYGTPTPLPQIANIQVSDARTIIIQPWERNMLGPIERVLINGNIGITPANDGEVIRLSVPPLTEERRKELVKKAKHAGEESKVGVRTARHKALDHIKKAMKEGVPEDIGKRKETELQDMVNKFVEQVDKIIASKEKEIMTV